MAWSCGADLRPWKYGEQFLGRKSAPTERTGMPRVNIYKWTLTLPMVESSLAVFAIYFSGQLGQIENTDFSDIVDFFL